MVEKYGRGVKSTTNYVFLSLHQNSEVWVPETVVLIDGRF